MKLTKYIACVCEGAAEQAIIELLLDSNKLIFDRSQLLDGMILRCRSGRSFEERYLRKGFSERITVLRILDSRRERFKLSKAYEHKVDVVNIITAPEVEMLVIFNEGKYRQFKKSKKKPSEFCRDDLNYASVKTRDFVMQYFHNVDTLVSAIMMYRRMSNTPKGEYCLVDLLDDDQRKQ